ncbi:LLM class F420-dependent oxidoreductase [Streptomyces rimosus]|uniref:LLM class F420-dependent oxidoreductase n=1 Tax=Streptomyces rimosus TaxID=1927 RepID=UPI0004C01ED8|nr:LLM class F420-dependent oxidoreductase [Streptomyces rimosus]
MEFAISTFVTDEGIRPDALGRALEERGFDTVFLAEHSHIPVGSRTLEGGVLERRFHRTLDPFLALTAMASATSRLLLGTGIALLIQRDTLHTAKEVATLDLLSGGRVLLGVGTGWNRQEMSNHGTDPATRGALLDEQIDALRALWTQEEAEFHGKHVDFAPVYMWPKPVQRPHPPVYIGGHSPAARARFLARGDGWMPLDVTPDDIREVRAELARRGRGKANITVPGNDPETLPAFAEAGADRALLALDTMPESDTLRRLDELAEVAERYRR